MTTSAERPNQKLGLESPVVNWNAASLKNQDLQNLLDNSWIMSNQEKHLLKFRLETINIINELKTFKLPLPAAKVQYVFSH